MESRDSFLGSTVAPRTGRRIGEGLPKDSVTDPYEDYKRVRKLFFGSTALPKRRPRFVRSSEAAKRRCGSYEDCVPAGGSYGDLRREPENRLNASQATHRSESAAYEEYAGQKLPKLRCIRSDRLPKDRGAGDHPLRRAKNPVPYPRNIRETVDPCAAVTDMLC
jgi:hypothetical protein